MKKICVLGSINIDLVTTALEFPMPGETIHGLEFSTFPGGKGANQAVAASKLGAPVTFLGKIGRDAFGEMALFSLKEAKVDTRYIEKENTSTGTASITVNGKGQNSIVCVPGANGMVDVNYVMKNKKAIEDADILMIQLEIPVETVEWAAEYASLNNKIVILDPAPAKKLSDTLLKHCSIITPNETELEILTGVPLSDGSSLENAKDILLKQGVRAIVHKCSSKGAYLLSAEDKLMIAGFKVDVVDTTAAGDSFNAGLAVSLAEGKGMKESIRFANAVGALSVTKMGAQSAMPSMVKVMEFMNNETL